MQSLEWASSITEMSLSQSDLDDGFVLLQLLTLISPSCTDLSWYSTTQALECENIQLRNYTALLKALNIIKETHTVDESLIRAVEASISGSLNSAYILDKIHELYLNKSKKPVAIQPIESYTPNDSYFLALVKWLFNKNNQQVEETINISNDRIKDLCSGRIYLLVSNQIFQRELKNQQEFLELLIKLGFFSVSKEMRKSVLEMMSDESPFYESVHVKLIEALITADSKKMNPQQVVDFLRLIGKETSDYPYDIEDAMLILVNQALGLDFQDFTKDVDASILELTVKELTKSTHSLHQISHGLDIAVPWEQDEIKENCCLYVNFLCQVVQKLEHQLQQQREIEKECQLREQKISGIKNKTAKRKLRDGVNTSRERKLDGDEGIDINLTKIPPLPDIASHSRIKDEDTAYSPLYTKVDNLGTKSGYEPLPSIPTAEVLKNAVVDIPDEVNSILDTKEVVDNEPLASENLSKLGHSKSTEHLPVKKLNLRTKSLSRLNMLLLDPISQDSAIDLYHEKSKAETLESTIISNYKDIEIVEKGKEREPEFKDMDGNLILNNDSLEPNSDMAQAEIELLPLKDDSNPHHQSIEIDEDSINLENSIESEEIQKSDTVAEMAETPLEIHQSEEENTTEKDAILYNDLDNGILADKELNHENIMNQSEFLRDSPDLQKLDIANRQNQTFAAFNDNVSSDKECEKQADDVLDTAEKSQITENLELNENQSDHRTAEAPTEKEYISPEKPERSPKRESLVFNQEFVQKQQELRRKRLNSIIKAKEQKKAIALAEKEREIEQKKAQKEMQLLNQERILREKTQQRLARYEGEKSRPTSAKIKPIHTVKSNKTIIRNALQHVCLAGSVNEVVKKQVLRDLDESEATHFVLLFKDANNFVFRGLYFWDPVLDQTVKLFAGCSGPLLLEPEKVLEFYKYDSGARTFKSVPTKSFGRSVHAVSIPRDFLPIRAK